ncbi:Protein MAIN-LIKE 2 [Glycine max]|nr:Protein MAIN-LIKE 2 [Glycine max]
MVTTRGLGRALGGVIGRAMGREDNYDLDEASQRQRPIASAPTPIVEDVHHVDDAANEVFQQPQEVAIDAQGFPSGPHDHQFWLAIMIMLQSLFGMERSRIEAILPWKEGLEIQEFERLVDVTRLSPTLHVDEAVLLLVESLEVTANEARAETVQCHGAYTVAARAYLLHFLGCTLFSNKSVTHMHVMFLDAFRDLTQSGSYAWGAGTLVHMYDNLNDASKSSGRQLCWIYEHFPSVAEAITVEDYHERKPHA